MTRPNDERSLIIIKPDAVQRNLIGEIITRFEKKGLKLIGLKMMSIHDALIDEHYAHIKDKPFFPGTRNFMTVCPVVVMALSGINAVSAIRLIVGPTALGKQMLELLEEIIHYQLNQI
jgi:nucleoside-diphosphate kinase